MVMTLMLVAAAVATVIATDGHKDARAQEARPKIFNAPRRTTKVGGVSARRRR